MTIRLKNDAHPLSSRVMGLSGDELAHDVVAELDRLHNMEKTTLEKFSILHSDALSLIHDVMPDGEESSCEKLKHIIDEWKSLKNQVENSTELLHILVGILDARIPGRPGESIQDRFSRALDDREEYGERLEKICAILNRVRDGMEGHKP